MSPRALAAIGLVLLFGFAACTDDNNVSVDQVLADYGGEAIADHAPTSDSPALDVLPGHPLVAGWRGTPADCATQAVKNPTVTIRMTFAVDLVVFERSYFNGTVQCFHRGQGAAKNVTDVDFDMVGYTKTLDSCNLATMFPQRNYHIDFEFLNAAKNLVFIKPTGSDECYRLAKQ